MSRSMQRDEQVARRFPPCSRAGRAVASAALAVGLVGGGMAAAPRAAFAESASAIAQSDVAVAAGLGEDPFAWADGASAAQAYSALPDAFDLRTQYGGAVTPVRFQNPWGACWAFAVMGASEASIRAEANQKGVPLPAQLDDLSERQLAWFAYTPLPEGDDSGQGGEGLASVDTSNPNARLNVGGLMALGTSLFSSGVGPVAEEAVPYRGNAGNIDYKEVEGELVPVQYSKDDDWSVGESYRFAQDIEIEETVQLPSPGEYSEAGDYAGLARANDAIKAQLMEGRAVAVGFMADQSRPGQITPLAYMNPGNNDTGTWAHYTPDAVGVNHAVTIVGWDDSYSARNFGNSDPVTGEVDPAKRPAGDGAWIVKNSWGSDEGFPNGLPGGWGTDEDGDGGGDGYFYLSYYDKTVSRPEAYDFDVKSTQSSRDSYYIHQYDYLPAASVTSIDQAKISHMANVFVAGGDEAVRKLTCQTTRPNTVVTFDVYLLGDDGVLPTDGAKLATVEETFEYGGFHVVDLGDDAFSLGEGERFSVVVTQHCLDDDRYYASFDIGTSEAGIDEQRKELYEEYHDDLFAALSEAVRDAELQEKFDELVDGGLSEDEALAQAQEYVESDDVKAEISLEAEKQVRKKIDEMAPEMYAVGVVNEGESFIYSINDETGQNEWADLADVAVAFEAQNVEIDNFPIKAYAYDVEEEPAEPASPESMAQLESAIEDARSDLTSVAVSADGSDVAQGTWWVTEEERAAFEAAIDAAERAVSAEEPLATDIAQALAALSDARKAFDAAKADGLKVDDDDAAASGAGADAGADGKGLAQTGDAGLAAFGAAALAGAGAVVVGAVAAVRRRR